MDAAALGSSVNALSLDEREKRHSTSDVKPVLRIDPDAQHGQIVFLSWDTEGGNRAQTNLLRSNSPLVIRVRVGGVWRTSGDLEAHRENLADNHTAYTFAVEPSAELRWTIHSSPDRLVMTVAGQGRHIQDVEAIEVYVPFDPQVTPTTLLPQSWSDDGGGTLPAIISSPDFGQIILDESHSSVKARLEGNRDKHTVDLILELPESVQATNA